MTPAQPLAFVLAALALPLVAAYLHQRKRVARKVPSAILFRVIAGQSTPTRRSLAHPRHLVSLVLMVIALAATVLAIADLRREAEKPRDFVIVLDTSASMGAVTLGSDETRLDVASQRLADALQTLGPGDRVALVTTGANTAVRIGLTEDHARILELARSQEPSGTSAGAETALRIADAMCRKADDGSIVLLSDGVGVGVPPTTCPVRHVRVGRPGPNTGITALAVREADALGLAEVFLQLTSDTGKQREVEVELRVDETVVDVLSLDLPPEGQVERLHRLELPPGERVVAVLRRAGDDILAADDEAWAPRHSGLRVSVLLVAKSRVSFLAEALRLHPRVDLRVVGPHDRVGDDAFDLVMLETPYAAGPLPRAPHLVALGTPPADVGLTERGRFAAPEIVRWSFDDPLLRFVDLDGIELPRATTVTPDDDDRPLIDTDQGALAVTTRWDERDLLYVGFAPAESDLVLRVGFVNLVANLVEWAAPTIDDPNAQAHALAGTETALDPPERLEGTVRGDFDDRGPADRPLWHWLALAALTLIVVEWALPLAVLQWRRLRAARDRAAREVPR